MADTPFWTKKYTNKTGGRDHLGYEYVGVLMLEKLMPGISNITNRVRYFSFFAWVIYRFFKSGQPATEKNFQNYLKRKSFVYLFANGLAHLNESNSGIDGIESIVRKSVSNSGQVESYKFTPEMINEFGGNYWIYKQKIEQVGITGSNNDQHIAIPSLTDPIGVELAKAFERSIESTVYFTEYCDQKECEPVFEIPTEVLLEYSNHGGVLELNSKPDERKALYETLIKTFDASSKDSDNIYSSTTSYGGELTRRASLAMYLDCISQITGQFTADKLRQYQYYTGCPNSSYAPQSKLVKNASYWKYFQARQYMVYAIESMFRVITSYALDKPFYLTTLFDQLLVEIDCAEIKKKTSIDLDLNENLQQTLEKIAANQKPESNETSLHHLLENNYRVPQPTYFIGVALILLLQIFLRFKPLRDKDDPSWQFCRNMGIEGYFTVEDFFKFIEDKISQGISTAEFLHSIFSERIISQHLNVAMFKLASGNDTAHFNLESQIFTATRVADANMNAPKFPNILNFLSDLGLITQTGPNQYALTTSGKELLDEYR